MQMEQRLAQTRCNDSDSQRKIREVKMVIINYSETGKCNYLLSLTEVKNKQVTADDSVTVYTD